MRASDTSEVLFQDCRIPADQLLGKAGQGFVDSMRVLDAGRICIAALAVGLAQGAYEAALRYSKERKAFGKPIRSFKRFNGSSRTTRRESKAPAPDISRRIPEGSRRADDDRVGDGQAVCQRDRGQAADDGVQIHGGYGFIKDYPAEKFYRDVKLTTIGEGTSEIQRLVIARQLLASMSSYPRRSGCWRAICAQWPARFRSIEDEVRRPPS